MNKIIIALGLALSFSVFGSEKIEFENTNITAEVKEVCLGGWLFAVVISSRGDVSITQVFNRYNKYANPPAPVQCIKAK